MGGGEGGVQARDVFKCTEQKNGVRTSIQLRGEGGGGGEGDGRGRGGGGEGEGRGRGGGGEGEEEEEEEVWVQERKRRYSCIEEHNTIPALLHQLVMKTPFIWILQGGKS